MVRMKSALDENPRIEMVEFLPFRNSIFSLFEIRKKARNFDIVHVHFGGMYALAIWLFLIGVNKRKFITFHGTDIHAKAIKTARTAKLKLKIKLNQRASFWCIKLYNKCGMVSKEMMQYVPDKLKLKCQKKFFLQPLGVDYDYLFLYQHWRLKRNWVLNRDIMCCFRMCRILLSNAVI